jgi:hypothetical protein
LRGRTAHKHRRAGAQQQANSQNQNRIFHLRNCVAGLPGGQLYATPGPNTSQQAVSPCVSDVTAHRPRPAGVRRPTARPRTCPTRQ